jgi:DNA-binding transcriptional MocR family regulator
MTEGKKGAVLALLASHGVPLIEDDIYGDIYFGTERPRPFMALDGDADVIYCSSFSKTLAPGYRVGWIASGRHMPSILRTKVALTLCGPALPQAALADFLSSGGYDGHLRRVRRTFEDTLDQMIRSVEKTFPRGVRVTRPVGGFVLWIELPGPIGGLDLFHQALRNGICFAPGDAFSASGRYGHCLRLSCGSGWDSRMEKGLRTLGELASEALSAATTGDQ